MVYGGVDCRSFFLHPYPQFGIPVPPAPWPNSEFRHIRHKFDALAVGLGFLLRSLQLFWRWMPPTSLRLLTSAPVAEVHSPGLSIMITPLFSRTLIISRKYHAPLWTTVVFLFLFLYFPSDSSYYGARLITMSMIVLQQCNLKHSVLMHSIHTSPFFVAC